MGVRGRTYDTSVSVESASVPLRCEGNYLEYVKRVGEGLGKDGYNDRSNCGYAYANPKCRYGTKVKHVDSGVVTEAGLGNCFEKRRLY